MLKLQTKFRDRKTGKGFSLLCCVEEGRGRGEGGGREGEEEEEERVKLSNAFP